MAGLVSGSNLDGRATILVANKSDLVRLIPNICMLLSFEDEGGEDVRWETAGRQI